MTLGADHQMRALEALQELASLGHLEFQYQDEGLWRIRPQGKGWLPMMDASQVHAFILGARTVLNA